MKRVQLLVNVTVPDEVGDLELRTYVKEAVSYWGGQFHPSEPLFLADTKKVTTKILSGKEGNHGKKNS